MHIRRFLEEDSDEVLNIIHRNFIEINSKDYSLMAMQDLVKTFNKEKMLNIASYAHTYVVCDGDKIVGTGSISSYFGSETDSILLTIFVLPEYHGKKIGRKIIETLENDELFLRATRIEIPSSITSCGFYEKCGYTYKNGIKELDEENLYRMEKFR